MAEIVNLRQARKRRDRREAAKTAADNRAAHGLSKAEKQAARTARDAAQREHDGHLLTGVWATPPPSTVRDEAPPDNAAVAAVITAAFGRPDEADLVARLRADGDLAASLVAAQGDHIVGHVALSPLTIHFPGRPLRAYALAPVAVEPAVQGKGIGQLLVRRALDVAGGEPVIVLGDPDYYGRFGFSSALAAKALIDPFAAGPAFMAIDPQARFGGRHGGGLSYAKAFGLKDA